MNDLLFSTVELHWYQWVVMMACTWWAWLWFAWRVWSKP